MKVALSDASRALVAAAAIAITLLINAQPMNAQTEAVLGTNFQEVRETSRGD